MRCRNRACRTRLSGESGTAAVEFAIVLPLLLILIFGVVDVGRLLYTKISLASASQEGARASSLGLTSGDAVTAARAAARGVANLAGLANQTLSVNVGSGCSAQTLNDTTTVSVSTTFRWLTPIGLFQIFGSGTSNGVTRSVSSQAVAQCLV